MRLLVLHWQVGDASAQAYAKRILDAAHSRRAWSTIVKRRGVHILTAPDRTAQGSLLLADETGLIIGPLFRNNQDRHERVSTSNITRAEIESWCNGDLAAFPTQYWGNYLVILHDRFADKLFVLRDPMGSCRCYEAGAADVNVVFTHAADFVAVEEGVKPDLAFLGAFIAHPRLVCEQTAMEGVREILAGECVTFGRFGARSSRMLWAPTRRPNPLGRKRFDAAASQLRQTIVHTARAWSEGEESILHRLSGGLDSSCVLASLVEAGAREQLVCVNQYPSAGGEGDERIYARRAANAFGAKLEEHAINAEDMDYRRLLDLELEAKPSLSALSFALSEEELTQGHAGLVTSGKGGDQVMQRSAPPELAADAVIDGRSWGDCWEAIRDTAAMRRQSIWNVIVPAMTRGVFRQTSEQTVAGAPLATEDGHNVAVAALKSHPWIAAVRDEGPGRVLRARRLIDLQFYHWPSPLSEASTPAFPLASQPVVEFCLRVAPYVMIAGGKDRALERAAFKDCLPDAILKRTQKGDTTRFSSIIMERNIGFLRELLIGGLLEQQGVVDNARLRAALRPAHVINQLVKANLMSCLVAEIWLRKFAATRSDAAALSASRPA